jgi:hypothetical protein
VDRKYKPSAWHEVAAPLAGFESQGAPVIDETRLRRLQDAGATAVFNIYTEAGTGFANHLETQDTI